MRVLPASFEDGYDVHGPKATRVGKESVRAIVPAFHGLQKAYDSVDRTLLWQVLTRFGAPPQIIEVIRQFPDGMRACIRNDDGRCSEGFHLLEHSSKVGPETELEYSAASYLGDVVC